MNHSEWALLFTFGAVVIGIGFISPEAALMLGGFAIVVMLAESGSFDRITTLIGGKS